MNTFGRKTALVRELGRILEIAAHARLLVVVNPTDAGFAAPVLHPRLEVVRQQLSLHGQKAEGISLGLIESDGAPIEANDPVQCLGNRVQQGFLGQVRNNRIVDLEQAPVLLFTSAQRLFRLLALRDVDEGDHRTYGSPLLDDGVRPILHRKARAILSPIHLIISVHALAFLEAQIDRALFNGIGRAVFVGMMFQRMKIPSE